MNFSGIRTGLLLALPALCMLVLGDFLLGDNYRWEIVLVAVLLYSQFILIMTWFRTIRRLRQNEKRFRRILDNLPVAVSCSDQNNNIIFNNKKYLDVIGYSIQDTPTVNAWFEKAYPDEKTRKRLVESWLANLESFKYKITDQPLNYNLSFTCRDGSIKNFAFTYFMAGEYLYAVFNDITDRLQAEKSLRSSRELLSLAAELARLGPWKFDLEKNVFEFGDEFYAIYGTSVAREGAYMAPDVYAREFVHPDDAWVVEDEVIKAHATPPGSNYSKRLEHRIIRRDGKVRTIAVQIKIVKDAAGKIVKWYGANQDITEQKRFEEALHKKTEEIQRLAYTDSLTGLPNRAYLIKFLEEEMMKARRGRSSGAVLFIDLDNLKAVNDAFGHSYGDDFIILAGKHIVEQAGSNAFVGRIGGDEFMVILPGESNRQNIGSIVGGIISALNRDIEIMGLLFHISASAGAAVYPEDGDTAEEIFKRADNAMYAAKQAGRNCWRFYDANMQSEADKKNGEMFTS